MSTTKPAISHNATRFYNEFPGSPYVLPADAIERQRLELQHAIITRSLGGKLYLPDITLQDGDRVLDCATGSGIWLLDLASRSPPTVSFTGTDVSAHLFPPAPPHNVSFQHYSTLALPASLTSHFTLVNQRLVHYAFPAGDWPLAISALFRATAPGGYVQLQEFSPHVLAGPHSARNWALHSALAEKRGLNLASVNQLADMLRTAGCVDVQELRVRVPLGSAGGDNSPINRENLLGVYMGLKTPILSEGGFGIVSSEEDYDELIAATLAEWESMPDTYSEYIVAWGRKP